MDQRQETKKEKMKKPLSAALILAGLFFFINPNIALIDVLPDFIGAVLVIAGTLRFADIDERARSAQKALIILAFVDAGKMLALLLLRQSQGTAWNLIFTFAFGLGEGALFIYGMLRLFSGITYRAQRYDCVKMLSFNALSGLTVLIAALKSLLAFLPELTVLSSDTGVITVGSAGSAQIAHFVYTALTVFNIAVVTIYGVGWFIYMTRYFKTLDRERDFLKKLGKQYEDEVGSKPSVLTYRALKTAGLLIIAALVFLLPLYLDGTDHLPDFVAGILLLLASLRLYSLYKKQARVSMFAGGVYTVLALAEWLSELFFKLSLSAVDYDAGYYLSARAAILRYPARMNAYIGVISVGVVKYLSFAVFLFFFLRMFRPIIAEHTGISFDTPGAYSEMKDRLIKNKLSRLRAAALSFGVLLACAGAVRRILRMFNDFMLIEYAELIAAIPFALIAVIFIFKLQEGIDNKYYIEK